MPRTGRGGDRTESPTPPTAGPIPGGSPTETPRQSCAGHRFPENPLVGIHGQQAQQRILDAALQVYDEVGYHQCGIVRITEVSGLPRASFYQYFSSKEDVFRHLAGQVGRQLMASAEVLRPMTPDAAGWSVIRAWVDRHTAIYARYEPVFEAFQAAAESDDAVASNSVRILHRHVASVRARVTATTLPSRQVDPVIELLLHLMTRTPRFAAVLRNALPDRSLDEQRVNSAITDLIHRTLFGLDPSVNVQPAPTTPPAQVPDGAALLSGLQRDAAGEALTPAATRTLALLLEVAHEVLVTKGYHGTRIDDITAAAGMSRGAFYRYFENKDHLVRLLAIRAVQRVSLSFDEIPDIAGHRGPASTTALHAWLRKSSVLKRPRRR